mgnify:CR=1 FL=1
MPKVKKRNNFIFRLFDWSGKLFFTILYKVNNRVYMQLYPVFLRRLGVQILGRPVYIAPSVNFDANDYTKITLGDKCVISSSVRLLTHDYSVSRVAIAKGEKLVTEFRLIKPIFIGENSFVGTRSIIMPGVIIGKNVIVGAGSVVTRNIEDNMIVAGNPARIIGSIDEFWEKVKSNTEFQFYE